MSQEQTEFVDVLPLSSLKTCLALVKQQEVSKKAAALAILNLSSYAAGQFLPDEQQTYIVPNSGPFMFATPLSLSECEMTLNDALPDDTGTMKAGKIDWKSLMATLLPLLLKILV